MNKALITKKGQKGKISRAAFFEWKRKTRKPRQGLSLEEKVTEEEKLGVEEKGASKKKKKKRGEPKPSLVSVSGRKV